jgi:hypothetical protein
MSEKKICDCCNKELGIDKFRCYIRKNGNSYDKNCKRCSYELSYKKNKHTRIYKTKNWWEKVLSGVRMAIHKKNRKATDDIIRKEFIFELYEKQNGLCYWLKIPLDLTYNNKSLSPSIDRLDNDKGYSFDNIVLSSRFANLGRNTSTKEEFEEILKTYILK